MSTLEPIDGTDRSDKLPEYPRMTPKEAVDSFEWNSRYLEEDYHAPLIAEFCSRTKDTLGINPDEVENYLKGAMELSTNVFRTLFIDEDGVKQDLKYHNDVHAKLTTIVGTELFLGALEELSKDPDFLKKFKEDPNLAIKLIKTASFAFALHEYKDWWVTSQPDEKLELSENMIKDQLQKEEVNIDDIGLILELDIFGKDLDGSIRRTQQPGFRPDFVEDDRKKTPPVLSKQNDANFYQSLLNVYGSCLRTADYAQVLNPNYLEEIDLVNDDGSQMDKNPHFKGPVVLAHEFSFRPKAFPDEWVKVNERGNLEVVWSETGIEKQFYFNEIRKNIGYGINFMKKFSLEQYEGMKKAMERIETKLS
jgi:hypothetical protein